MLGQLQADSGRIHVGTKLEVAYFDQHRAELDPDKTVMDNLAEGKQEVMVNGKPRHVLGYLQDFLFHPKRAMTRYVRFLAVSGTACCWRVCSSNQATY